MQPVAVRRATSTDLLEIKRWLDEEGKGSSLGFHNNWNLIEAAHSKRRATVLTLHDYPIGFYTDGTFAPDIFEIHPAHRHEGLGTKLARHMLRAWRRRASVLEIECAPTESLTFWQRFGFVEYDKYARGTHAYLILERSHRLGMGPRSKFSVQFYKPNRDWDRTANAFRIYEGEAELRSDGSFLLPQRAICFHPEHSDGSRANCVMRVEIDGDLIFEDKVKRERAESLGVQLDTAYYVDALRPSALAAP